MCHDRNGIARRDRQNLNQRITVQARNGNTNSGKRSEERMHPADQDDRELSRESKRLERGAGLAFGGVRLSAGDHGGPRKTAAERFHLGPGTGLEARQLRAADGFRDQSRNFEGEIGSHFQQRGVLVCDLHTRFNQRCSDQVRRNLDRGNHLTGPDRLTVEQGKELERIDGIEPGKSIRVDVEYSVSLGGQVQPALL